MFNQPLTQLRTLSAEQADIHLKLKPLNDLMAAKQKDIAKVRADFAAADTALDAAAKHAATVQGLQALGSATAAEVKAAMQAKQAVQDDHGKAQSAMAGIRLMLTEADSLGSVGYGLAVRLSGIANTVQELNERYLRGLADEAASEYAATARALAEKLAVVLAYQQALAAANFNPDLLTAGTWNFGVPSLNSPSGKNAGGCLVTIENSRQQQPEQFAAIRARIAADGVSVAGL